MSRHDKLQKLKESMGKGLPAEPKKELAVEAPNVPEKEPEGEEESRSKRKKKTVEQD